jgi:hypothetical protein
MTDAADTAQVVVRPPFAWVLAVLAGLALNWLMPLPFMPVVVPAAWLGSTVIMVAVALFVWAIVTITKAGSNVPTNMPTTTIVDSGPFRFTRNPIYLGMVMGLIGLAIALNRLAAGARNFLATGYRANTTMPMMRDDVAIGALTVARRTPGPLSDKQREVLKTFADQAVIAIENTRLLNELRESLEQQTATSKVLSVISSSPGDLEPMFQAMLENATRICDAKFGFLFRNDDGAFQPMAMLNVPSALADFMRQRGPYRPEPGLPLHRLLQTKKPSTPSTRPLKRCKPLLPSLPVRDHIFRYRCSRRARLSARFPSIAKRCVRSTISRSSC